MRKKIKNIRAAVIGSGVGGLAVAYRLNSLGLHVDVFESAEIYGGKIREFRKEGFRFDMGPSLFTLPQLLGEIYNLYGLDFDHEFKYKSLDTVCKYFYEDELRLNVSANPEKFAADAEKLTLESGQNILKFLKKSRFLYDITAEPFLFNKLFGLRNIFSRPFLRALLNAYRLSSFTSMHDYNKNFFQDKHIIQLFDRYATYNGSNPYRAPATLNLIAHLENNIGAFFPEKGMFQIADSLYRLAVEHGVNFYFRKKVEQILVQNSIANGIIVDGEKHDYDIIVSDVDVKTLYASMLPGIRLSRRIDKQELSTSALIFYWGISNSYPELEVHNILFSRAYKEEFINLSDLKNIYCDPTVYIFISSKIIKSDAPDGYENWYVMVNAPENTGQDWNNIIKETRKNIIDKINRMLKTNIEKYILFEEMLDPVLIEKRTGSWHGSLYGMSSNSISSAFLRHPNYFSKIKNLYFTGGSVHPGGGIPLCLSSATIIFKHLKNNLKL